MTVVRPGTGPNARPRDYVKVNYSGKLGIGREPFDTNDGEDPLVLQIGVGEVIKGWDIGICQMNKGCKALLIVPPELGYGAEGAGDDIPPNSVLYFTVELIDFSSDPNFGIQ